MKNKKSKQKYEYIGLINGDPVHVLKSDKKNKESGMLNFSLKDDLRPFEWKSKEGWFQRKWPEYQKK